MPHNVFICWSGAQSKEVALALREWLPTVVQVANPFMSETDIDQGTLWRSSIAGALDGVRVGIACLTPENLGSPWLHFEAGAIARQVNERTNVYTYLTCGVTSHAVRPPLGDFQHSVADKTGTLKMLRSMNRALSAGLSDAALEKIFERSWPDLEASLKSAASCQSQHVEPPKRDDRELLQEILDIVRSDSARRREIDQFLPDVKEASPFLRWILAALPALAPGIEQLPSVLPSPPSRPPSPAPDSFKLGPQRGEGG